MTFYIYLIDYHCQFVELSGQSLWMAVNSPFDVFQLTIDFRLESCSWFDRCFGWLARTPSEPETSHRKHDDVNLLLAQSLKSFFISEMQLLRLELLVLAFVCLVWSIGLLVGKICISYRDSNEEMDYPSVFRLLGWWASVKCIWLEWKAINWGGRSIRLWLHSIHDFFIQFSRVARISRSADCWKGYINHDVIWYCIYSRSVGIYHPLHYAHQINGTRRQSISK